MKLENDYVVTHIGDGKFEVTFPDGKTLSAGNNLCGMIRYTYFEDFTLPPLDWQVKRSQLFNDYFPKVHQDIIDGKIEPGKHEF